MAGKRLHFFQFNPLLSAVAVGAVETRHIVYPLRVMARPRLLWRRTSRFARSIAVALFL